MLAQYFLFVSILVFSVESQGNPKPYLILESISDSKLVSYAQLHNRSNDDICGHFDVSKPSKRCPLGVWVLYNSPEFEDTDMALGAREFECFDEPNMNLKSVRLVGSSSGIFDTALTQFEGINYAGNYYAATVDDPYIVLNTTRSLILTGTRGVEVFELPNYGGNSVCISPMIHNMVATAIPDIQNDTQFPFPHQTIRSIKFGCIGVQNNYKKSQNKYLPTVGK